MQIAPANYEAIYNEGDYIVEHKVRIDGVDYDQDKIWSMSTRRRLFADGTPMIGCAMVGEIDLTVTNPEVFIEKRARIVPYIRIRSKRDTILMFLFHPERG